jgi:hypothetical protein
MEFTPKTLKIIGLKSSSVNLNPFTGDFDLPKRICLNGLFLFFFDKVRHFLSKFSILVTSQKKVFFALSEASKNVFEKCCSTSFFKYFK